MRALPFMLAAIAAFVLAVSADRAAAQAVIGDTDAPVQRYVCNYDRWVTGLIGRQGAVVDAVGITCSEINLSTKTAVRPGWINFGPHGGAGGGPKSIWCDDGLLPTGVVAAIDREGRVVNIKLTCGRYEAIDGRPQAYERAYAHRIQPTPPYSAELGGPYERRRVGGATHGRGDYAVVAYSACPDSRVLAGLAIWADQYVRGVQAACR